MSFYRENAKCECKCADELETVKNELHRLKKRAERPVFTAKRVAFLEGPSVLGSITGVLSASLSVIATCQDMRWAWTLPIGFLPLVIPGMYLVGGWMISGQEER